MSITTGTLVDRRFVAPQRAVAPRILVVEPDRDHARALTRVVRAVAPEARVCTSVQDLPDELVADIVVAPWDGFAPDERDHLLDRLAPWFQRRRVVLHAAAWERAEMSPLLGARGACNLLARTGDVDTADLMVTLQKLAGKDVFGIEKYFPWGAPVTKVSLRSTGERDGTLELAKNVVAQLSVQSRFADTFSAALDELITNALYNAPVDAQGRHRFAATHRNEEVMLDGKECVDVTFCADGQRIGVSVSDPFGTLRPETTVAYLAKCMRKGDDQVDQKAGGAGLGLYCAYEAASHLALNVQRGRRTEAIAILDVRGRFKDFASRPKSFNVFVVD